MESRLQPVRRGFVMDLLVFSRGGTVPAKAGTPYTAASPRLLSRGFALGELLVVEGVGEKVVFIEALELS